jgi:hypothetical protein
MSFYYNEYQFKQRVDNTINQLKTILDVNRNPLIAAQVPHKYEDKYLLAEQLTRNCIATSTNTLEFLGLNKDNLIKAKQWSEKQSVTLRFYIEERCDFIREATRKVESDTAQVTEIKGFGGTKTITNKVITEVTEYFWSFEASYQLFLYRGTDIQDKIILQQRTCKAELITKSKNSPQPKVEVRPTRDINIYWLLAHIDSQQQPLFSIDRKSSYCKTPRRNWDIDQANAFFGELGSWGYHLSSFLRGTLFPIQQHFELHISLLTDNTKLFLPFAPCLEERKGQNSLLFDEKDNQAMFSEQKRSIAERLDQIKKAYPENLRILGQSEAILAFLVEFFYTLRVHYADSIEYIEAMLRNQLVAAIGKELQAVDFINYMRFHNRKLFSLEYEPKPFSYAVRRPQHYPEGEIAIEMTLSDRSELPQSILTSVRKLASHHNNNYDSSSNKNQRGELNMGFSINAATRIEFGGDRYVHAWLNHSFAGDSGLSLAFTARARQFSSFIVLLGRINSATEFAPKHAVILQNKDSLNIPLVLEQLPTAKAFKDATASLSPEQQRFAKAYRAMQLESTLFGIVIIQLKPQLERVLNLPNDSLTKEIALTEELLELFIKYQIPSDQLSYEPLLLPSADVGQRVAYVASKAKAMQAMIQAAKQKELDERAEAQRLAEAAEQARLAQLAIELALQQESQRMLMLQQEQLCTYDSYGDLPVQCSVDFSPSMQMDFCSAAPAASQEFCSDLKVGQIVSECDGDDGATIVCDEEVADAPEEGKPKQSEEKKGGEEEKTPDIGGKIIAVEEKLDLTQLPVQLDAKLEEFDADAAVRASIINIGSSWSKKHSKSLLAEPETFSLGEQECEEEKQKAFDLLDGLTRSGTLAVESAELHVLLAATHVFTDSLINTVIQQNINPIEKLERSALIIASTIQNKPAAELIQPDAVERVTQFSAPRLMNSGLLSAVDVTVARSAPCEFSGLSSPYELV